jgi:hypothetical protein
MMGVGVAVITRGEHLVAAAALAALGAGVSMLLAWALVRPPKAALVNGVLRIEAAHRHVMLDRKALGACAAEESAQRRHVLKAPSLIDWHAARCTGGS